MRTNGPNSTHSITQHAVGTTAASPATNTDLTASHAVADPSVFVRTASGSPVPHAAPISLQQPPPRSPVSTQENAPPPFPTAIVEAFLDHIPETSRDEVEQVFANIPERDHADVVHHANVFVKPSSTSRHRAAVCHTLASLTAHERSALIRHVNETAPFTDAYDRWDVALGFINAPPLIWENLAQQTRIAVEPREFSGVDVQSITTALAGQPASQRPLLAQHARGLAFLPGEHIAEIIGTLATVPEADRHGILAHASQFFNSAHAATCEVIIAGLTRITPYQRANVARALHSLGPSINALCIDHFHALQRLTPSQRGEFAWICSAIRPNRELSRLDINALLAGLAANRTVGELYTAIERAVVPLTPREPLLPSWSDLPLIALRGDQRESMCSVSLTPYAEMHEPVTLVDDPSLLIEHGMLTAWWERTGGKRPDRSQDPGEFINPAKLRRLPVFAEGNALDPNAI